MRLDVWRFLLFQEAPSKTHVVQELPEFFGVYVNNNGKLIHLDSATAPENLKGLAPDVSIVLYSQGAGAGDVSFVRLAELHSELTEIKLLAKPLEKPDTLMLRPASPLAAGAYVVNIPGILSHPVVIGVGSEMEIEATLAEARGAALRGLKTLTGFDGKHWTNSLEMKFTPIPMTRVAFCIWETRARDYGTFLASTRNLSVYKQLTLQELRNTPLDHPVSGVYWDDANDFCEWLTERERAKGVIGKHMAYRLPTDEEWSMAVGLQPQPEWTPIEKSGRIVNLFPWGTQWPPPKNAGNYGIDGGDEFQKISPVGSFAENEFGLFDLGGNMLEWCGISPVPGSRAKLLRGGSWQCGDRDALLSSNRTHSRYRFGDGPGPNADVCGFRCVLVVSGREVLSYVKSLDGVKAVVVTAETNTKLDRAEALFGEARELNRQNQHDAAFRKYLEAAEMGLPKAQNSVGVAYATGKGATVDIAEAVRWYKIAAENSDKFAPLNLATLQKDPREGYRILKNYALKGDVRCQFTLAEYYLKGVGTPKDINEALRWATIASERGDTYAKIVLARVHWNEEKAQKNYELAFKWARAAVEDDAIEATHTLACNQLAWFLATCPDAKFRNGSEALKYAQIAVEKEPSAYYYDTLAAAYARAAVEDQTPIYFLKARGCQEEAIRLMADMNFPEKQKILDGAKIRLERYQNQAAWTDDHVD